MEESPKTVYFAPCISCGKATLCIILVLAIPFLATVVPALMGME